MTGSGWAGVESAVVNTIAPGDTVLCVSAGYFGETFAKIAQIHGAMKAGRLTEAKSEMTMTAARPTSLQIDGDAQGPVSSVTFRSVPRALGILV